MNFKPNEFILSPTILADKIGIVLPATFNGEDINGLYVVSCKSFERLLARRVSYSSSIKEKDFKRSIEKYLKENGTWILTNGYLPIPNLNSNFQASSVFHMNKENITALNQLYGDLYDDFSVYNTPLDRVKALYPLTYEFHHFNL